MSQNEMEPYCDLCKHCNVTKSLAHLEEHIETLSDESRKKEAEYDLSFNSHLQLMERGKQDGFMMILTEIREMQKEEP